MLLYFFPDKESKVTRNGSFSKKSFLSRTENCVMRTLWGTGKAKTPKPLPHGGLSEGRAIRHCQGSGTCPLPRAIWLSGTSFVSCTQWAPYKLACYRFTEFWVLPVAATGFADTAHCLDIPHPDSGTQGRCGLGSLLSLGRITELHRWRGYKELFPWHTSPENRYNWEESPVLSRAKQPMPDDLSWQFLAFPLALTAF